jgi:lysophospholipid acyltransferase (LPLAT)-like uncharacterized protein
MAFQSGAAIVPLSITSSRYFPFPSWDSKKFPLPFNRITVKIRQRIFVTAQNFDSAAEQITAALAR